MFINTASFSGGMILFSGDIEIDSLTDYFINSMQKNGWKLTGEARYKNTLLVFTKPNKSCMISIYMGDFGIKTKVTVHISEDAGAMQ